VSPEFARNSPVNSRKEIIIDFLKNIIVNLKATGPAAVLIAWVLGVTLLGIFGNGEIASHGMSALYVFGIMLVMILGQKVQ